jgi:hypothetical protein
MWARFFASLGAMSCRQFDLFPEFGREINDVAVQFVLFALSEELSEPNELSVALCEELDGFGDDIAGVRVLAGREKLFDFGFDLGRHLDDHGDPPELTGQRISNPTVAVRWQVGSGSGVTPVNAMAGVGTGRAIPVRAGRG